jgi:HK97 family phage prohead protease
MPPSFQAARKSAGLPGEGMGLEFLGIPGEIKADVPKRRIELWVAAYDNVDHADDVISFGAAKKTIRERGPEGTGLIKGFWNHQTLLGPVVALEEHKRGILQVMEVTEDPSLDVYLQHAKNGAAAHGSIGFTIPAGGARRDVYGGKHVRRIDELSLFEGSLVIWPCNEQATLQAVKSFRGELATEPKPTENKSLWGFSDAINSLARLQEAARTLANLPTSEWAQIDADEAAAVQVFLEMLTRPVAADAVAESVLDRVLSAVTGLQSAVPKRFAAAPPSPPIDPDLTLLRELARGMTITT